MSKSYRSFFILLIIIFYIAHFDIAQVKVLKGWGPGKRATLYDNECRRNVKSPTLIFYTFMAETKRLVAHDQQVIIN